jgi:imidazolonepropionase-like amidohydrolase
MKIEKNRCLMVFIMLLAFTLSKSISAQNKSTASKSARSRWQNVQEEGAFLVYRRQSLIGEEKYSITSNKDSIVVTSEQGENERGKITGNVAELHLKMDLSPTYYENRHLKSRDTSNNLKVQVKPEGVFVWELDRPLVISTTKLFFPLHSEIPAAMEMMLYHRYFDDKVKGGIPTLPRGEVSITFRKKDTVEIQGKKVTLDRYVVRGINWGGRTIWLDASKNLIAVVKANTQIREMIRKGYEEAMPIFVAGNVEEEMAALLKYTQDLKGNQSKIKALVGADIVDGLTDITKKDMTVIIANGYIKKIGKRTETEIPQDAQVIDVKGKTLIPGLWDMHAHSNQVQWGPAYLAGGVTTIRDNGNEVQFETAFRDALNKNGATGPHMLLAGMTDGPGNKGNGIIRARSPEEAKKVVAMYKEKGFDQIKIYNSVKADILKVLTEEAHKNGMTVTGHVPVDVGNAVNGVDLGMDMFSHEPLFLSVLFPEKNLSDLGKYYLIDNDITPQQIENATRFFLKHKTVLDPTISVFIKEGLPKGVPVESIIPEVGNIAYELWEGKRFQSGLSPENSKKTLTNIDKAMEIIGQFSKAGIPVVAGTDNAVPVFSLYLEIESYSKLGKLSPLKALQCATIIPAKAMGLDSKTGTLEVGKEADIAILGKNPLDNIANISTVVAVVTNGDYYESNPLWRAVDFKNK